MFGGRIGLPELFFLVPLLLGLVAVPIWIAGWWKIFSKAGYSGALSLAMIIPGINFLIFLWFAFSSWPAGNRETSAVARS